MANREKTDHGASEKKTFFTLRLVFAVDFILV